MPFQDTQFYKMLNSPGTSAMAQSLLQQSGPSTTPRSRGQIMGNAMGAYQGGILAAQNKQLMAEEQEYKRKVREQQQKQWGAADAVTKRKQDFLAAIARGEDTSKTFPIMTAEFNKLQKEGTAAQAKTVTVDYWQDGKKKVRRVLPENENAFRESIGNMKGITFEKPEGKTSFEKLLDLSDITDPVKRSELVQANLKRQTTPEQIINVPAGYKTNKLGDLEVIKGGPADRPNQQQAEATLFSTRAGNADMIISTLEGEYSRLGLAMKQSLGDVWGVGGMLEAGGNILLSPEAQKVEQAKRNFINAVLRRESGAVINPQEFQDADKQYFPAVGDSEEVVAQKRSNRQTAIKGIGMAGIKKIGGLGNDGPPKRFTVANPDGTYTDPLTGDIARPE